MRFIALFSLIFVLFQSISFAQNAEEVWETEQIFDVPESVLLNDTILYVSNIGGEGLAKDGNGFISMLSTTGREIKTKWSTGLNAPKGMCMNEQFLFVSDIDEIIIIDKATGEKVSSIKIDGAKFLNDIVITEEDHLYVTDFYDKAVYRFNGKKVDLFVQDEVLDHANGLHYEKGFLYVGSSTQISEVDLKTREIKKWADVSDNVDGIEKLNESQMLISSWSGKVQLITQDKPAMVLFRFEAENHNTADMDYDHDTKIMYIPTFYRNTVFAAKLLIE